MWSQGLDGVGPFQLRIFSDKLKEIERIVFKYMSQLFQKLKISRK